MFPETDTGFRGTSVDLYAIDLPSTSASPIQDYLLHEHRALIVRFLDLLAIPHSVGAMRGAPGLDFETWESLEHFPDGVEEEKNSSGAKARPLLQSLRHG
jgi:hypothetical protein